MAALRVLYNSVCPVCREGICYMERQTKRASADIEYVDVSANPCGFAEMGVSLDDVRLKLHAILPDGELVRGWPAIAAVWRVTPRYRW